MARKQAGQHCWTGGDLSNSCKPTVSLLCNRPGPCLRRTWPMPACSLHAADVSRFAGRYEHVFESTTAGVTIQAPQLDINTVAAGGGSRLFFRSGVFQVGLLGGSGASVPGMALWGVHEC